MTTLLLAFTAAVNKEKVGKGNKELCNDQDILRLRLSDRMQQSDWSVRIYLFESSDLIGQLGRYFEFRRIPCRMATLVLVTSYSVALKRG